ncbi:MAG: class I SAM-dependent methyltransferase [Balneolaceae bacterium]|nr:class I SAM-dependent methyltransferase [Balneolaceae bacterium]
MKPDQISQTAAFIAIKFYGLTKDEPYRSLFDNETIAFYDHLVKDLPAPLNRYHKLLNKKWLRPLFQWSEELLLPGDLMHILMRKYYISTMVDKLKGEYLQLVVLGAGFDHLSARCSAEGMTCLEIDTPHMAVLKKKLLAKQNALNENISIQEGYFLEQNLMDVLNGSNITPHKKTIILAEGFFDYLPEMKASEILTHISDFFEGEVHLISTAFALQEFNAFHRFVFKTGVRMVGETLLLNHSLGDFEQLLENTGFEVQGIISGNQMQQEVMRPNGITLPILTGFYLVQGRLKKSRKKDQKLEHSTLG